MNSKYYSGPENASISLNGKIVFGSLTYRCANRNHRWAFQSSNGDSNRLMMQGSGYDSTESREIGLIGLGFVFEGKKGGAA